MATDFNELVGSYGSTKENLIKRFSEEPSFLAAIGDVTGLDVLDLACGDGYYTRQIKRAGAGRVVGVDIAEAMIASALASERAEPLGITYAVHDVTALPDALGSFDVVLATYLFHYAPTFAALAAMFAAIGARLRHGGRLVSVGINPALGEEELQPLTRYGAQINAALPLADGDPINVTLDTPIGPITFQCYHWTWGAYERAMGAAGFGPAEQQPILVSDQGLHAYGSTFWEAHVAHPSLTVFVAQANRF